MAGEWAATGEHLAVILVSVVGLSSQVVRYRRRVLENRREARQQEIADICTATMEPANTALLGIRDQGVRHSEQLTEHHNWLSRHDSEINQLSERKS